MEWIEVTGRSVTEAVDAALDELGVDEADIEYEVVEEARRGFFGRLGGGTPARIRARVRPISREKPDRRRRSSQRERPPRERAEPGTRPERVTAPAVPERESERAGASAEREGSSTEVRKRRPSRRRARPGATADRAGSDTTRSGTAGSQGQAAGEKEEKSVSGSEASLDEQVALAENFTRGLVERFGVQAEISAHADGDDDVFIDINGSDLGSLIGPRAATLDAVQELVRTAVQRKIGGHSARVHVDVAGYRARRQDALAQFAREAARRALESGRDQVFEPMSPVDRKVVHDTINEMEGVATVSEGEEPRRRVIVKPV